MHTNLPPLCILGPCFGGGPLFLRVHHHRTQRISSLGHRLGIVREFLVNRHPRRRGHRRASSSTHPVSTPRLVQRTPDLVEASTLSEVAAHAVGVTTPLPGAAPLLAPWPQPCTSSQRHRKRRFTLALAHRTTSWAHDRVAGLCWHPSPGPPAPLASSAGRSHAAAHSRRTRRRAPAPLLPSATATADARHSRARAGIRPAADAWPSTSRRVRVPRGLVDGVGRVLD